MPSPSDTLSQPTRSADRPLVARLPGAGRVCLILLAAAALGGCAVGRELGTHAPMLGITTEDANGAIATVGQWGGLVGDLGAVLGVGAPAGLGGAIIAWLGSRAAKKREDAAWDEAARDAERKTLLAAVTGGAGGDGAGDRAGGGGGGTEET